MGSEQSRQNRVPTGDDFIYQQLLREQEFYENRARQLSRGNETLNSSTINSRATSQEPRSPLQQPLPARSSPSFIQQQRIALQRTQPSPQPAQTLNPSTSQQQRISLPRTQPSAPPQPAQTSNLSTSQQQRSTGTVARDAPVSAARGASVFPARDASAFPARDTSTIPARGASDSVVRDASVTRSRQKANDGITCPTCNNKFGLYIYQCGNGHSSCKQCKMRGSTCGVCGHPITDMRNIALEAYVANIKSPCPNSKDGCCLSFPLDEMDNHLKECPHGELQCPLSVILGKCNWRGKVSQLSSHFSNVHPEQSQADVNMELCLPNILFDDRIVHFLSVGNFNFLFELKVCQATRMIYIFVKMLSTQTSAAKWIYEVHIYNKSEPRRKYQYSDICFSSNVSSNEVFEKGECATIPLPYAMTFINEGILNYKFFIKKPFDDNKKFAGRGRGRGRGRC